MSLVVLFAVPPALAVAGDRGPSEVALDQAVTARQGGPQTDTRAAPRAADTGRQPLNAARYRAEKAAANSARVSQATPLPGPSATQTAAFEGLNRLTGGSSGTIFAPPDTILAKSPTTSLEAVNSGLRLFNSANTAISTMNLNAFFSTATSAGFLFDPKVYYDRNAANPRYVVVALQKTGDNDTIATNNTSRIRLAIARTPNPTTLASTQWCRYNIEGRRNIGTATESWADYPGLGTGADALLISANQFRFTPPRPFTFAVVHAIRKLAAYNNAAACPALQRFVFQASAALGDTTTFTLQPAQHYTSPTSFAGSANPAYLVNNSFSGSNNYHVWRVRNMAGAPTMSSTATRATVSNAPVTISTQPDARQPGTAFLLDSGDPRVTQAAGRANLLNHVNGNGCQFTASTSVESCWLYTRTTVGQNAAGNVSAVRNEFRHNGFGDNTYAYWPGVAVNAANQVTTPMQFSSPTAPSGFLSGRAAFKGFNVPYSQTFAFAPGTCAQTNTNRTGDYVGAQADPVSTSMWVAAERATTVAGLAGCNWSTRIARITP